MRVAATKANAFINQFLHVSDQIGHHQVALDEYINGDVIYRLLC
jgi:hypothetical protein